VGLLFTDTNDAKKANVADRYLTSFVAVLVEPKRSRRTKKKPVPAAI
jgi:hypothetical protein